MFYFLIITITNCLAGTGIVYAVLVRRHRTRRTRSDSFAGHIDRKPLRR